MTLAVTPLYAGLVALLFFYLSVRVVLYRRGEQVSMGDGGDPRLLQLTRAHGNCAEYATLGLVLLAVAELQGTPLVLVHLFGLMLLGGRVAHAAAFLQFPMVMRLRVAGMALTFSMLNFTALALILQFLF